MTNPLLIPATPALLVLGGVGWGCVLTPAEATRAVNPRWLAWVQAEGLTAEEAKASPGRFAQWLDRHLVAWATANGFVADLRFDPPGSGVVIRTRAEANRAALSHLGQDAFTEYLQKLSEA